MVFVKCHVALSLKDSKKPRVGPRFTYFRPERTNSSPTWSPRVLSATTLGEPFWAQVPKASGAGQVGGGASTGGRHALEEAHKVVLSIFSYPKPWEDPQKHGAL